jgi:Cytochrome P450
MLGSSRPAGNPGAAVTGTEQSRRTIFHPKIAGLFDIKTRVFRIDPTTVGIADGALAREVLACRPIGDLQQSFFVPASGLPQANARTRAAIQALAQDIRAAVALPPPRHARLDGIWPKACSHYLRAMIFAQDPWQVRLLSRMTFVGRSRLVETVEALASLSSRQMRQQPMSALARLTQDADGPDVRRDAVSLYRKVASVVCTSVAALLTNILWLASPIDHEAPIRPIILETLRLLPPLWMLQRRADPAYAALDAGIGSADDLLILPLLAHRNQAVWSEPDRFLPQRWSDIGNPDLIEQYIPFGHGDERCPARHLVLLLVERVLADIAEARLTLDPFQCTARIPLAPQLSVARLKVIARGGT